MRQGQVAMEFAMLMSLAFAFLVILLLITLVYLERVQEEKQNAAMEDVADQINQELLLAAGVEEGYERTFLLPQRVEGQAYSINLSETQLTIILADGRAYAKRVPVTAGSLLPGTNRIQKDAGVITLDRP